MRIRPPKGAPAGVSTLHGFSGTRVSDSATKTTTKKVRIWVSRERRTAFQVGKMIERAEHPLGELAFCRTPKNLRTHMYSRHTDAHTHTHTITIYIYMFT